MKIPWARSRVSYTIELEKEVLRNISDRSVSATAKSFEIDNWMVADIVHHRVEEAKRKASLSSRVERHILRCDLKSLLKKKQ